MIELNVLLIVGVVLGPMHYSVSREDYITGHRTDVRRFSKSSNARLQKAKLRRIPITCGIRPQTNGQARFVKTLISWSKQNVKIWLVSHLRRKHDDVLLNGCTYDSYKC